MIPTPLTILVIVALAVVVWAVFYYAGMPLDAGGTAVVTILIALVVVGIRAALNRSRKDKPRPRKKK